MHAEAAWDLVLNLTFELGCFINEKQHHEPSVLDCRTTRTKRDTDNM